MIESIRDTKLNLVKGAEQRFGEKGVCDIS